MSPTHARDPHEPHRAATPLELLFDLTFVVAVAAVVPQFAHAIVEDHAVQGLIGYVAVFFAIWWAWMNFTWFASAFDCDDAFYRILTMVQMAGVLVLAAGVGPAFERSDFSTAVVGYVIMRIALVIQWLRVAIQVPRYRRNALRFAVGITAVQSLWVVRLFLGEPFSLWAFALFAALELLVPSGPTARTRRPGIRTTSPNATACSRSSSWARACSRRRRRSSSARTRPA
jgi:low temperature requirement protein LtrA